MLLPPLLPLEADRAQPTQELWGSILGGHHGCSHRVHLQGPLVGDAVADDLVDRGAHGLGEVPVVERRGVCACLDRRCMDLQRQQQSSRCACLMTLSVCCQRVDDRLHVQAFASPTHHFVNLVRCDTRPHCSMSLVQDLPGNQACFADACYLLRGVDRHCVDIQRASAFSSTSTD